MMCNELTFVNGEPYPCGCSASFSDGNGEYSDVITVKLCDKHRLNSNPEKEAEDAGYYLSSAGTWVNEVDMLLEAVQHNMNYTNYDVAHSNLALLKKAIKEQRVRTKKKENA